MHIKFKFEDKNISHEDAMAFMEGWNDYASVLSTPDHTLVVHVPATTAR